MNYIALVVGALFIGLYKFVDFANKADTCSITESTDNETKHRLIILGAGSFYFALGIFLLIIGIVPAFIQ